MFLPFFTSYVPEIKSPWLLISIPIFSPPKYTSLACIKPGKNEKKKANNSVKC